MVDAHEGELANTRHLENSLKRVGTLREVENSSANRHFSFVWLEGHFDFLLCASLKHAYDEKETMSE